MGFRSTFCSDDYSAIVWPEWFREKYRESVNVPEFGVISSKNERKLYGGWADLIEDIQKAIDWDAIDPPRTGHRPFAFIILFLHECGGVTRFAITKDRVICSEPTDWEIVEHNSHGDQCSPDCRYKAQDWTPARTNPFLHVFIPRPAP